MSEKVKAALRAEEAELMRRYCELEQVNIVNNKKELPYTLRHKLRQAMLEYDAEENIFYHSCDLKQINFERWLEVSQEVLVELGTPWSVALFRPRAQHHSKFWAQLLGAADDNMSNIARQVQKIFNLQKVVESQLFTNTDYSEDTEAHGSSLLEGMGYWEWGSEQDLPEPLPMSHFFEKKKNINKHNQMMKIPDATEIADKIDGLEKGYYAYGPRANHGYLYVPGVDVDEELIKTIPAINRIANEADLITAVMRNEVHSEMVGYIAGVTEPYIYCGEIGSGFGGHVEDMHTMSLNISLAGGLKLWVAVDMSMMKKLVALLGYNESLNTKFQYCFAHPLAAKAYCFTKDFMDKNRIQWCYLKQVPGDIIITYPYGFHFGYNLSFNLNVASNHVYKCCLPYVMTAQFSYRCLDESAFMILAKLMVAKANETSEPSETMSADLLDTSPVKLKVGVLCHVKYRKVFVLGQVRAIAQRGYCFTTKDGRKCFVSPLHPSVKSKPEETILGLTKIQWHGVEREVVGGQVAPDTTIYTVYCCKEGAYADYVREEVSIINETLQIVSKAMGSAVNPSGWCLENPFSACNLTKNVRKEKPEDPDVQLCHQYCEVHVEEFRKYWLRTDAQWRAKLKVSVGEVGPNGGQGDDGHDNQGGAQQGTEDGNQQETEAGAQQETEDDNSKRNKGGNPKKGKGGAQKKAKGGKWKRAKKGSKENAEDDDQQGVEGDDQQGGQNGAQEGAQNGAQQEGQGGDQPAAPPAPLDTTASNGDGTKIEPKTLAEQVWLNLHKQVFTCSFCLKNVVDTEEEEAKEKDPDDIDYDALDGQKVDDDDDDDDAKSIGSISSYSDSSEINEFNDFDCQTSPSKPDDGNGEGEKVEEEEEKMEVEQEPQEQQQQNQEQHNQEQHNQEQHNLEQQNQEQQNQEQQNLEQQNLEQQEQEMEQQNLEQQQEQQNLEQQNLEQQNLEQQEQEMERQNLEQQQEQQNLEQQQEQQNLEQQQEQQEQVEQEKEQAEEEVVESVAKKLKTAPSE